MAATPIITASRTTSSILSPLSTACASVTAMRGSGAGVTRCADSQAHTRPVGGFDDRLELGAASVEDTHTIAGREPKHARQVLGFIIGESDEIAGCTCRRRKEPRMGHATEL